MQLLLTGFEPFDGSLVNPSMQVAQALAGKLFGDCRVESVILPVEGSRMPNVLFKALDTVQPDAVLGLGEAPRRSVVSVERVAINLQDYSIPDNRGIQRSDTPIRADGPTAYFSTLPVRKIHTALKAAGIPVEISLTAGAYLCNHLMFTLLDYFAVHQIQVPAGFMHLLSLPEQVIDKRPPSPSMALETSIKAISIAIEIIVKSI
jgi:pyroglutamyl-peptidase